MTIGKLAAELTKREGKRSKVRIGDTRELLKLLTTLDAEQRFASDIDSALVVLMNISDVKVAKLLKKKKKVS